MQLDPPEDETRTGKFARAHVRQHSRMQLGRKRKIPWGNAAGHLNIHRAVRQMSSFHQGRQDLRQVVPGQRVIHPGGREASGQANQVVVQPDKAAVHDFDHLIDAVSKLETAVLHVHPALGQVPVLAVQIQQLTVHLLTSPHVFHVM